MKVVILGGKVSVLLSLTALYDSANPSHLNEISYEKCDDLPH